MRGRRSGVGLVWRHQTVPEEWAVTRDNADLLVKLAVAAEVNRRQGGTCCFDGCDGPIISYPHAIPADEGGAHDVINRAGVCGMHSEAMRAGHDPTGALRVYLQTYLQRYYERASNLAPDVWRQIAIGRPPVELEVTGS